MKLVRDTEQDPVRREGGKRGERGHRDGERQGRNTHLLQKLGFPHIHKVLSWPCPIAG